MRYCASEKFEIIRLIEQSNLSVRQKLLRLGIRRSTFYNWLKRYQLRGIDGWRIENLFLNGYGISFRKISRLQLLSSH